MHIVVILQLVGKISRSVIIGFLKMIYIMTSL